MSIAGWFISLVIVAVIALLVFAPLFTRRSAIGIHDDTLQRDQLLTLYERVLNNLRDLDEDFSTGKIQQQDYEQERETWMQRGVQILKALDAFMPLEAAPALASVDVADGEADIDGDDIDAQIEARIAVRRQALHKENS